MRARPFFVLFFSPFLCLFTTTPLDWRERGCVCVVDRGGESVSVELRNELHGMALSVPDLLIFAFSE